MKISTTYAHQRYEARSRTGGDSRKEQATATTATSRKPGKGRFAPPTAVAESPASLDSGFSFAAEANHQFFLRKNMGFSRLEARTGNSKNFLVRVGAGRTFRCSRWSLHRPAQDQTKTGQGAAFTKWKGSQGYDDQNNAQGAA